MEFNEWTREGRRRIRRKAVGVGADGDLDRYQQGAYVSMFKSGRIASIWVVPQRFQTFVPLEKRDEGLFFIQRKEDER